MASAAFPHNNATAVALFRTAEYGMLHALLSDFDMEILTDRIIHDFNLHVAHWPMRLSFLTKKVRRNHNNCYIIGDKLSLREVHPWVPFCKVVTDLGLVARLTK